MNENAYLSVSDINKYIKTIFDENDFLSNIYIKGEISNLKLHSRGHLYFSLKDEASKINAVMFSFNYNKLSFTPKDGDKVLIRGKINVYEASGSYQVYAENMELDGIGNLHILFEELKKKLSVEGLFDESHKKKIPSLPKKVGVITAPTGAAVKDIITTINRRYPLAQIIVFPTLVQGENAKENIVKRIIEANKSDVDVIILGRGGGSIEDLWAFNEEIVARAIYNSAKPIISAVGHEIDFTISDFVSDLRAPTPTAAAELAVPSKLEILRYLNEYGGRVQQVINNKINKYKDTIIRYSNSYILKNPYSMYEVKEQKLDMLLDNLNKSVKTILTKFENNLNILKINIELLNPTQILSKGYSIVKINNKIIKNSSEINKNDTLEITFEKGKVLSQVTNIIKEK